MVHVRAHMIKTISRGHNLVFVSQSLASVSRFTLNVRTYYRSGDKEKISHEVIKNNIKYCVCKIFLEAHLNTRNWPCKCSYINSVLHGLPDR